MARATLGKEGGSLESAVFVGCCESGVRNSMVTGGRSLKNKSQTLPISPHLCCKPLRFSGSWGDDGSRLGQEQPATARSLG